LKSRISINKITIINVKKKVLIGIYNFIPIEISELVNPLWGLIKKVEINEVKIKEEQKGYIIYEAIAFFYDKSKLNAYSSTSQNKNKAVKAAIGEVLERMDYDKEIKSKSNVKIDNSFLKKIDKNNTYEDKPAEVVEITNYEKNTQKNIPVGLLSIRSIKNDIVKNKISTGMASGKTLSRAIQSGINEVIERHDFSLTWHKEIWVNEKYKDRVTIEGIFYERYIYDISLHEKFHTFVCVLKDLKSSKILIGASTNQEKDKSKIGAFLEAVQSIKYIDNLVKEYNQELKNAEYTKITNFKKHACFYTINPQEQKNKWFLDYNYTQASKFKNTSKKVSKIHIYITIVIQTNGLIESRNFLSKYLLKI
jgi:ribosomal protein S12 methylthiotransferase accessory factor YcaO